MTQHVWKMCLGELTIRMDEAVRQLMLRRTAKSSQSRLGLLIWGADFCTPSPCKDPYEFIGILGDGDPKC